MRSWQFLTLALAGFLLASPFARAQDVAVRMAVCNPGKVFDGMDEKRALEEKMKNERDKINLEVSRRRAEVEEIKKQLSELKPDTPIYKEKSQLLLQKAIDFEVWARLTEAEMARAEKETIKSLFEKIREATKEVAESKKIDLVLSERRPDLSDNATAKLTPDQLRQMINASDVLYSTTKADITDAVILVLNKKYASGAAKQ